MAETFAPCEAAIRDLKGMGYLPDQSMASLVAAWWKWYRATDNWYTYRRRILNHTFRVQRSSVHPARFVSREWASAILDDDGTTITVDALGEDQAPDEDGAQSASAQAIDETDQWLQDWLDRHKFVSKAQAALERAFALGTAALALQFTTHDDGGVTARPKRYDARMVLPLTWDDDEITECAFVTSNAVKGKAVQQLSCHVWGENGTYHILTRLYDSETGRAYSEDDLAEAGVLADYDTGTHRPTFAILRPALDNVYSDNTAMGQSVFADAIDAIKGVENAWDSLQTEVDVTKVKVWMSEDLIDVVDKAGKPVPIPMSPDNLVIAKLAASGAADATIKDQIEVYQPDIRTGELSEAHNLALAMLGSIVGFGPNYLRIDKDGGLKTAKEVSSDNSTFARNLKKHENEIRPQLEGLLGCLIDCVAGTHGAKVNVRFDDSIISDTETDKNMFMAEIGAGIRAPWEYRVQFLGESEEVAQAAVAQLGGAVLDDILPGTLD